ncbi:hypothetical protein BY996DRAFT_6576587 [Phakopsora pachyrhizi]|nr:hypothetical protein BY996DRAFT_6576587 [Phakopsora pachyrhizi]
MPEGATDTSHDRHRKYPKPVSQQERAWAGWKPENRTKVDNHRADKARRRAMAKEAGASIDALASQRRMKIVRRMRKLWEGKRQAGGVEFTLVLILK